MSDLLQNNKNGGEETGDFEDLEALRDLEELRDLIEEKESESRQQVWGSL